jgi:hypothetical protein
LNPLAGQLSWPNQSWAAHTIDSEKERERGISALVMKKATLIHSMNVFHFILLFVSLSQSTSPSTLYMLAFYIGICLH